MRSPFWSTSSDPLIETPPPSTTMSSNSVDCAFLHHVERRLARLARHLDPARQYVVELQGGEIGLDAEAAVLIADLADHLDRDGAADSGPEIEPEPRAAGVIQRCLQPDVGVALARLAIIQRGRLSVDLDVALDLIAGVVGDDLQRVGFQLLVHHELVGGKSGEIRGDGVGRVGLGHRALDRHAQRDGGGDRCPCWHSDRSAYRRVR